jgi:hypothetical protein
VQLQHHSAEALRRCAEDLKEYAQKDADLFLQLTFREEQPPYERRNQSEDRNANIRMDPIDPHMEIGWIASPG